ncbi:MAG: fibronectin type III domain-containing protein [Kiritimatiellae bacterium]|nr:fibronectin type III domain-containing protein [Kiritimatiellia bacterium]
MKSRSRLMLAALGVSLLLSGLLANDSLGTIRVAVNKDNGDEIPKYVDPVESILDNEPGFTCDRVSAAQIQNGILSNYDVLVMPGGHPDYTKDALGSTGYQKIRDFVSAGGGYVGQCNGTYNATFIGILAAEVINYPNFTNGGGTWTIRKEGTGGQTTTLSYLNGPVLKRKTISGVAPYVILASFLEGGTTYPLNGKPAIVVGQYGQGNVIGSSGHFELMAGKEHLFVDQVRWAAEGAPASSATTWHDVFETQSQTPAAPSGLTATSVSASRIDLNWTDNSDNETGFKVDRRESGTSAWVRIGAPAANASSYRDTGLPADTHFYYKVKAYNAAGNSPYSNVAYAFTSSAGPLAVHPSNPRYFTDATGRAVYLTGSHIWFNIHAQGSSSPMSHDEFELFLDRLQGYGHNHTRLWTGWVYTRNKFHPHPWNRTGPGTASDGLPKFDLTRFNQSYFDLVRERVLQVQARGMYCSVMFFGSFNGFRDYWETIPWHPDNNINPETQACFGSTNPSSFFTTGPGALELQRALVRKFIDTLNDVDNLIWETMNEPGAASFAWNDGIIAYARAYEAGKPKQHLLGMTGGWKLGTKMLSSHADWISPDWTDYKTGGPGDYTDKVVMVDTDHLSPWYDLAPEDLSDIREWVWRTFTRGHHTLLMDRYGSSGFPSDYDSIRLAMGRTRHYAGRFTDLAAMQPSTNLSSSAYCLANPGQDYLVYNSGSASFTIDLEAGTYDGEWYDVAHDQVVTNQLCAAAGGTQSFSPPFSGQKVLFLHRTGSHTPAAPTGLSATADSTTEVTLNWQDNSDNETDFKIRRGIDGITFGHEIVVAANLTSYTDAGLSPGTTYYYKIKARGAAGDSPYCTPVSVTTRAGGAKIEPGAVWRYRKGTTEASRPAGAWRAVGFDDSGWAAGPAPIGYGAPDIGTTLGDMRNTYSCVFLRAAFEVENPALVNAIHLWARHDDGFVLWINGEEAARVNVGGQKGDPIAYNAFAAANLNGTWRGSFTGSGIPGLRAGSNVVAVQVFNRSLDSSDLAFDAELSIANCQLSIEVDADRDAMPDAWEDLRLAGLPDPADRSPSADPDGDGTSNLEEFIAGTDPVGGSQWFGVNVALLNGKIIVSVPTVEATGSGYEGYSRHYALEQADAGTGAAWSAVPGYEDILGAGQLLRYTNQSGTATIYRARVWLE